MSVIYPVMGINPEDGKAVKLEIGWAKEVGYFVGVDRTVKSQYGLEVIELMSAVEIASVAELVEQTRGWLTWSRRLYQAMLNAPVVDYLKQASSGDPTARTLIGFDDRFRQYAH